MNKPSIYKGCGIYKTGEGGSPTPPQPRPFPMDNVPDFTIVLRLGDGIDNPPEYSKGTLTKKPEYEAEWGNVWFLTYEDEDWSELLKQHCEIVAVLGANADGVTSMKSLCEENLALTTLTLGDLPSVMDMSRMCDSCYALTSLTLGDLPSVSNMSYLCSRCYALTSLTLGDTSFVTNMSSLCSSCYALTSLTLGDIPFVMRMDYLFCGCVSLTNFLPIYNKVKDKAIAVISYGKAFTDCGIFTIAGTAELAQIPTSWGGTGS